MVAKKPSREFVLPGDMLRMVRGDSDSTPAFRAWREYDGGVDLDDPLIDGLTLAPLVESMAFKIQACFEGTYLPDSVRNFDNAYAATREAPIEYLLFILKAQRDRLRAYIQNHSVEAALKRYSNIKRGVNRRVADLDAVILDPDQFYRSVMVRRLRRNHMGITRETELMPDEYNDLVEAVEKDFYAAISKITQEVLEMEGDLELIPIQIETVAQVEKLLAITNYRIGLVMKDLGLMEGGPGQEVAKLDEMPKKQKRGKRKGQIRPEVRRGRSHYGKQTKESEGGDLTTLQAIEKSIDSLSQIVVKANSLGKVKVLIAKNFRFMDGWIRLLNQFGLNGEVQVIPVHYDELKQTADVKTPLLVSSAMDRGGELWKRSRFENLFIITEGNPLIIRDYLQRQSSGKTIQ